jgi:hypothetical protein
MPELRKQIIRADRQKIAAMQITSGDEAKSDRFACALSATNER